MITKTVTFIFDENNSITYFDVVKIIKELNVNTLETIYLIQYKPINKIEYEQERLILKRNEKYKLIIE